MEILIAFERNEIFISIKKKKKKANILLKCQKLTTNEFNKVTSIQACERTRVTFNGF
jgi:hypothetical protein